MDGPFLLIQCGAKKRPVRSPARLLYCGGLFLKAREYAEAYYPDRWGIVSAKLGLILPEVLLEPYNIRMEMLTPAELAAWIVMARAQAGRLRLPQQLVVHAGSAYIRPLRQALPPAYLLIDELHGLSLGRRMAWYKARARRPAVQGGFFE